MLSLPPAYPAFSLLSCPLSPRPPSPAGKGEIFSFLMQGASPLASPWAEPGRHRSRGESRAGGGVPSESPTRRKTDRTAILLAVPAAKERGDRGRGTIRRKRRRRLRWPSPPGQIEQVPRGLAFFAACLPCLQLIFLPPIPPAPFPGGEGGDSKFISPGAPPRHPGVEPGRHRSRGRIARWRGACSGVACLPCR